METTTKPIDKSKDVYEAIINDEVIKTYNKEIIKILVNMKLPPMVLIEGEVRQTKSEENILIEKLNEAIRERMRAISAAFNSTSPNIEPQAQY